MSKSDAKPGTTSFRDLKLSEPLIRVLDEIGIEAEYSLVDLPAGMPKDIFTDLKKVRICGQAMNISLHGQAKAPRKGKGKPSPKGKPKGNSKARGKSKPRPRNKKPRKRSK